jgi:hypothetical protein
MAQADRAREAFLLALEQARRNAPAVIESWAEPSRPEAQVSADFSSDRGGGGEARWDLAMQWTDELAAPLARPASSPADEADVSRSETAAIVEELGLGIAMSQRQLARRWRDFIWRNHPDRQPEEARERAGARVAIANALYDEAKRSLAKRRS